MHEVTIYDTEDFEVTSYGNGWAYTLYSKDDEKSIWFQDDDAVLFMEEVEEYEDRDWEYNDILAELYSNYS